MFRYFPIGLILAQEPFSSSKLILGYIPLIFQIIPEITSYTP